MLTYAGTEMDYDEDEVYLANPAMAPCIIWHTPMRVKIAANLPHDMRAEVCACSRMLTYADVC
jgi:hypothetical protein